MVRNEPAPRRVHPPDMASLPSALCFVDNSEPGITRRKLAHGWAYYDPAGTRITNRDEIDRLNRIALPPAYRDAWFCPSCDGHIQAVGYDEKGRKQYRYHLDFRSRQEAEKYDRCGDFGRALPKIRARVERDLAGRRLSRNTVIAAVVRLLDLGRVRIGNDGYAKANKSFGATTLRNRHARISGGTLCRQIGQAAADHEQRCPPRPRRPPLAGPARPAPVPICRCRRRAPSGHLVRRQRLSARGRRL